MAYAEKAHVPLNRLVALGNMDIQDGQDKQNEKLLRGLQHDNGKLLFKIDLLWVSRLQFPHCIPLCEKESIGPFGTFVDVTVRSSRGVHPPSGGGGASKTGGSPAIAGTSNLVRVQAITA